MTTAEEKINDILSVLPIWDKIDALEYLGIKLNLTDDEIVSIAGQKAAFEKKEELEEEKNRKVKVKEFMNNMWAGADFSKAMQALTDLTIKK